MLARASECSLFNLRYIVSN